MCDTTRRSSLLKNIHLSHDFESFRSYSIRKSPYVMKIPVCTVQMISHLDSQNKFQMFTVFSGRHIGAPQVCTNMAFSYWAL